MVYKLTTTVTSTESPLAALLFNEVQNFLDFGVRGYVFIVHLAYFLYVGLKPNCELRSRTYIFLHNINAATFIIDTIYMVYIPFSVPSFSNPYANMILCTMTELAWSCLKYSRVLSLLFLAIYRYIACFKIRLYKRFNSKLIYIWASVAICWLVSIIIPNIFKFALNTTYSLYFCTDGFAPNQMNSSIVYYVVNTTLSSIVPFFVIIGLYVKIYKKLKDQADKTHTNVDKTSKLARLSRQFIVLNVLSVLATALSTFVDFMNVIAVLYSFNYYMFFLIIYVF